MNAVDEITLEKKTANYKRVPCRVLASTKHVLASRTHVCHCHRITGTCISETEAVELWLVDCRHQMLVADRCKPCRLSCKFCIEVADVRTGFLQCNVM